ncbi:hypothetical protein [Mangrovimonas sp. ST2L15]|nr:hypothetical protein [Mangrovimonas sp. ST2L15]
MKKYQVEGRSQVMFKQIRKPQLNPTWLGSRYTSLQSALKLTTSF